MERVLSICQGDDEFTNEMAAELFMLMHPKKKLDIEKKIASGSSYKLPDHTGRWFELLIAFSQLFSQPRQTIITLILNVVFDPISQKGMIDFPLYHSGADLSPWDRRVLDQDLAMPS